MNEQPDLFGTPLPYVRGSETSHEAAIAAEPKWRPIDGYDGRYEVSNDGDVRTAAGLILKPYAGNTGYLLVTLRPPKKNFLVHRLVATAFIRPPLPGEQVNHIDFDKRHNRVENLEWCNQSHNMQHYFDAYGGCDPVNRKLTPDQVRDLRAFLAAGASHREMSEKFGINRTTAWKIGVRQAYANV